MLCVVALAVVACTKGTEDFNPDTFGVPSASGTRMLPTDSLGNDSTNFHRRHNHDCPGDSTCQHGHGRGFKNDSTCVGNHKPGHGLPTDSLGLHNDLHNDKHGRGQGHGSGHKR